MPVVLAAAQGSMGQWAWPRIAAVYVLVVTPASSPSPSACSSRA